MTEEKFIHTNLKNELTHDFLVEILKHYHYEQKDMEMLKEVAGELRECLAGYRYDQSADRAGRRDASRGRQKLYS